MSRTDKRRERLARWRDQILLESDALVALEHRIARPDLTITIAHQSWYVSDLVATRLALSGCSAQALEGFVEERLDIVWLQAARIGALHLFTHVRHTVRIHHVMSKRSLFDQTFEVLSIDAVFDGMSEARAHLRLVAVADGFDQKVAQHPSLELELAQYVEDLSSERLSRFLELLKEPAIHVALASLFGHQVPEMADFGLTNAVDATEALLEAVGVPRQIVVHH